MRHIVKIFGIFLLVALFVCLIYSYSQLETLKIREVGYLNVAKTSLNTRYLNNNTTLIIFVHGNHDLISRELMGKGVWEKGWQDQMTLFIKKEKFPVLIDLGCNLGVFTLTAASVGSRVLAIDANEENTKRLQQSVIANGFKDKVTILLNAITNERKTFVMSKEENNIGGQFILPSNNTLRAIHGILMDDLRSYFDYGQRVVIKMDIQGQEINAIASAAKLFKHVNILAVLMEWIWVKENENAIKLIVFFKEHSFKPYPDFFSTKTLKASNYYSWPYDIVWRKL